MKRQREGLNFLFAEFLVLNLWIQKFFDYKFSVVFKIVTLLLEMSPSQYCVWVFGVFFMIVQSNVKRILCFSYKLFITQFAFHQVNNVLPFAINFVIDFKFSFCLLTDTCVILDGYISFFNIHKDLFSYILREGFFS